MVVFQIEQFALWRNSWWYANKNYVISIWLIELNLAKRDKTNGLFILCKYLLLWQSLQNEIRVFVDTLR